MDNSRRKFINSLLGAAGMGAVAAFIYPILSYLIPPVTAEPTVSMLKAGAVSDFPNNTSKIVKFGRTPVILIRNSDGEFAALAATCTHLDCIVQFREDTQQVWCACHNGVYDIKGRNVSGPPPRPLDVYNVNLVNDEIIITSQTG
jgi:Rieske Fe-S protein